nr:MAG TPA: hypothetical protein [Caudoviricetes sp.]
MVRGFRELCVGVPLLGTLAYPTGRCHDRERRAHLHRRIACAAQTRHTGVRRNREGCGRRSPAGRELPHGRT